jgi:hypothetical protein
MYLNPPPQQPLHANQTASLTIKYADSQVLLGARKSISTA